MGKKIALVLTSLLILTALLTTSYFMPPVASQGEGNHWKIMLAQKNCNAWIEGLLTFQGLPILGTEFFLECICELPEPQPLGQFVFWKVWTPPELFPTDIDYIKNIDVNKDGIPDITEPIADLLEGPIYPEEPHTVYQHVEEGDGPFGHWMVVVEVREQPFDIDYPFFDWQIMMKTHGVDASLTGVLTLGDVPLEGTDFLLETVGVDPDLQCQVVQTPWCTVPNDIFAELLINGLPPAIIIDDIITQFPWKYRYYVDPPFLYVDLEVTEVQSHRYVVMEGWLNSGGKLGSNPPWDLDGWMYGDGVPFASRAPRAMPELEGNIVTFTQRDPITGVVKLGIPAESYIGMDHAWWSWDVGTWFRSRIVLETQGCGWLFTGVGKDPLLGSVDYRVYNNFQGVYSYGLDGVAETGDDELIAGEVAGGGSAGAGPPIGPCLQELRGDDDIPCTPDDPLGRADPDGPNPPGSAVLYLPSTQIVTWWNNAQKRWDPLFTSPWPQLLTTGTAEDKVIESACGIDGSEATQTGALYEFFAGVDHPGMIVPWKHDKCNAYVTFASAWSVLNTGSPLGQVDVISEVREKLFREDCVIADVNGDEKVTITDIVIAALAFGAEDEGFGTDGIPQVGHTAGPDGIPGTPDDVIIGDDVPYADANYDARGDFKPTRGKITISDIVRIALDFGASLTPDCIIRP